MSKTCTTCQIDKPLSEFSSQIVKKYNKIRYRAECKKCRVIREQNRNQLNPEAHNRYCKQWRDNNKDHIKKYERERVNTKRKEDDQFRIKTDIVSHTRHFINGERRSYKLVNCSFEQLQRWFIYLLPDTHSWNDKNWHVDHVIPLSFFDLTEKNQLIIACHWSNLRPISEADNREKRNLIYKDLIINHIDKVKKFLTVNNDYQANMETCWWQRVELWYGKNGQDDGVIFEEHLKWAIRSQAPKVKDYGEGSTTKR